MAEPPIGTLDAQARAESVGNGPQAVYQLHRYLRPDGSFDYERYRAVQVETNRRKITSVWVREDNVAFLARYIQERVSAPRFGLCHGTRRGLEQKWFREYLPGCEVLGTEISDTAAEFPHTIQWDFHEVKPEWIDACDFIYSNSFDHTYDPEKCLNAWMQCIRPGGVCLVEHTLCHGSRGWCESDPFAAEMVVMPWLVLQWGRGAYCVREVLRGPANLGALGPVEFLVIQRN